MADTEEHREVPTWGELARSHGGVGVAGPVTYTVVGDAPLAEVALAAASVPSPVRLSWAARLRRACRAATEAVSG